MSREPLRLTDILKVFEKTNNLPQKHEKSMFFLNKQLEEEFFSGPKRLNNCTARVMKRHDYEGYDCGCFCLFNVIGHSVTLRCYSGVWICVLRMCREVRCLGRRSNRSLSRRNVSQMIRWLTVTSERQASPQSLSPDSHSVTFGSVTKSAHDFQARKSQNVIPSESIQHCRFSLEHVRCSGPQSAKLITNYVLV